MATTPRKTFPELQALSAPVVDSDVLAVYRTPGPAKRTTATIFADYIKTFFSAPGGSALVGFLQAGTGATARTAQSKLRDIINPKDFGALIDGTTNDTVAIQAAIAYAATRPRSVIDFGGGTTVCGALTIPNNSAGLVLRNVNVTMAGDVVFLQGAPGATSITFCGLENVYIDCSTQTTSGRRTIDFSLFSYSTFRNVRFFNNNLGTQHNLYVEGSVTVGPYYNVFDNIYSGGALAAVYIAPAASVSVTANNNTFMNCRFQPGASGRYGAIVGDKNQQNRFINCVLEDTVGGIGIDDDGIGTVIIGCRFEGMTTALNFGANSAGGSEYGSHFDSNSVKRAFAGASETKHSIYGSNNGDGSTDDAVSPLGIKVGGGVLLRGDPGFPSIATGQGFDYASGTLGHAWGGYGSTNDNTELNRLGQIVSANPTGTLTKNFAGAVNVAGALGVTGAAAVTGALSTSSNFIVRGSPGFPAGLVTGEGHAYANPTLGLVVGGFGATNDMTELNKLGQIVAVTPTGTLNKNFAGNVAVTGTTTSASYIVGANQVVGARGAAVADATGGAVVDAEARTALNALLARLRTHGLIAP